MMKSDWEYHNQEVINCRKCPRLVAWRKQVAVEKRKAYRECSYWGKPVPGFGDLNAEILVLGLAPGAHGSNRTGRMFTGDASGDFLFPALYRADLCSQPNASLGEDAMQLNGIFITAVCRCVPPKNRPTREEVIKCQPFLAREVQLLNDLKGIVALGQIAFNSAINIFKSVYKFKLSPKPKFSHGKLIQVEDNLPWLLSSYHPSRQNTQTGRLTKQMFDSIWETAIKLI